MIEIQNSIKNLLQTELNKNTQGLNFEVSLYNVKTNSLLENELRLDDTYATYQKRFIPFLIEDISGDYSDLQNLTALEATINASFLIPTDDTDFNNMLVDENFTKVSIALDELRKRLLAKTLALGAKKYLIDPSFSLGFKNYTENYKSESISLLISFPDRGTGKIIEEFQDSGFYLEKEKNNLKFGLTSDGSSVTVPYDVEKEYEIYISVLQGSQEAEDGTQLSAGDIAIHFDKGFNIGSTKPNYYLQYGNSKVKFRDFTLGGSLFFLKRIALGEESNGSFATKSVEIVNFITLQNIYEDLNIDDDQAYILLSENNNKEIGSVGNITFGFSVPNPTTNQFTFGNGLNYQQFEIAMDAFITDSVFVGNEIEYYLDDIRIYPIFRDEAYASETDPSQIVGQQVTRHTAVQTALQREYSIFYKIDSKLNELVEKITSENPEPNKVYKLKIKYPFVEREHDVIISQGALGITNNTPISITVKFDLASNILQGQ